MSEHKNNLCDGCALWPCGTHAPIGVDGCIVTECANRKPTSGELIATLRAQRDELALSLRKAALDFLNANGTIPSWWKDCVDIVKPILADKVEAIANAEKDKP